MSLSDYIKERLSIEEYSFSRDDFIRISPKNETALKNELSHAVAKGDIIPLRKGFYLIIPPRYSKQGKLPIQLYVENLFKSLNRPYYIGLYSAAKFHGASHQQIQRDYIITTKPTLLDISKGTIDLRFFTTANWPGKNILIKKADAGMFKISDPVLTAVDLIHYQNKLGGLNRMLSVLEELIEEITDSDLKNLLTWYPHKSTLQRLGFLLDELHPDNNLAKILFQYIKSVKHYPVLISPKSSQKPGAVGNRWKVVVNIKLESDI
ncbi:type IV toxin-antitoxin system AbiEi family antitoxin [Flavobacteriaceae bacterium F89]|uniref:Type IV toxin-antitoxin system AbiEi family antitoxin n=1 Tax=Cerina litoralis TaxID=2874477 RepID=A0AAE3ETT2_9FLAO|nr:type IV toxin-antitoxin system AbiEi family antitoxin [Cerina litoralis]MCG2460838.1 type IV toxin-antitoxin system AbiEi family antitoxin [Cerina litoralis]